MTEVNGRSIVMTVGTGLTWIGAIEAIEAVTYGKVTDVRVSGDRMWLTVIHHDMQSCPWCGKEIHSYGHGLCLKCWQEKSKGLTIK